MDERSQTAPSGTSPDPRPAPGRVHASSSASSAPAGAAELEAQRRLQEDTGSVEPVSADIARPAGSLADERAPSTPVAPIPAVKASTTKRLSSLARAQIGVAVVAGLGVVAALAIIVPGSGGRESGQGAARPTVTSTAEAGQPSPTAQTTRTAPARTARPAAPGASGAGLPIPETSASDAAQPDAGQYDADDRDYGGADAPEAADSDRSGEPDERPDAETEKQSEDPAPPHPQHSLASETGVPQPTAPAQPSDSATTP